MKIKLIKNKMINIWDLCTLGIDFNKEYEVLLVDDHGGIKLETFDKEGNKNVFHFYQGEYVICPEPAKPLPMVNFSISDKFLSDCTRKFGNKDQLIILQEECRDLIHACSKLKKGGPADLTEAIANVITSSALVARQFYITNDDIASEVQKKSIKYGFEEIIYDLKPSALNDYMKSVAIDYILDFIKTSNPIIGFEIITDTSIFSHDGLEIFPGTYLVNEILRFINTSGVLVRATVKTTTGNFQVEVETNENGTKKLLRRNY